MHRTQIQEENLSILIRAINECDLFDDQKEKAVKLLMQKNIASSVEHPHNILAASFVWSNDANAELWSIIYDKLVGLKKRKEKETEEKEKIKLYAYVEGGVLQYIYSNKKNIELTVFDMDDYKAGLMPVNVEEKQVFETLKEWIEFISKGKKDETLFLVH